jgi:hypothetical protein
MAKLLLIILFVFQFFSAITHSQCLSGNCINGKGKYDYGWCVYEGEFKNGKMDGTGTLNYGEGEKYVGAFSKGKENGKGRLYHKDSTTEDVQFIDGVRVREAQTLTAVAEKPSTGCVDGDCENGTGTYIFPSGNKYTGQFKNYARDGNGIAWMSNGDRFEGIFRNNDFASGSYYFSTGYKYTGNYDANGKELNGNYYAPSGTSATLKNGQIVPKVTAEDLQRTTSAQTMIVCPDCKGKGGRYIPGSTSYSTINTGNTYSVDKYGNSKVEIAGSTVVQQHTSYGSFAECSRCNGKGKVLKNN